ncbi:LolA family protein [Runella slithyformis]|uniref:Outer membrane lipoprotein carrier protein LolA n=1 Tax=Runella slithyformis (strain ATCC 29530 / DSM 19594 / LMG 11500 / NCIMB 11436 / LSU 4) TaxID=761193 RepID=A0A7U3ZIC2_RUNSL|nr:outer membrane lipoprotein carrier protein LolA [Runella slithyformis]AEI47738.1 outer membrane lipoprotein carrier protein LolA [Runella slithyformis DSM 19594]
MRNFLVIAVLFVSSLLQAQNDKRATAILDAMSSKYKTMTSFRVAFTYTNEGSKETLKGDATVKGTKFRLKMAGQEIFNDGKVMTTYIKESNEATVNNYDPKEVGDIDPTKVYTIYKKGYKYVFIEEVTESGRVYEVVELSPEKKESKVSKVQIKVDKKDKSVRSWKVIQRSGQRLTFKVDKLTPNVKVEDKFFAFDPALYKGVEVIDLR